MTILYEKPKPLKQFLLPNTPLTEKQLRDRYHSLLNEYSKNINQLDDSLVTINSLHDTIGFLETERDGWQEAYQHLYDLHRY